VGPQRVPRASGTGGNLGCSYEAHGYRNCKVALHIRAINGYSRTFNAKVFPALFDFETRLLRNIDLDLRLDEAKKDFYRKRAKEEGYRSRAAFKLLQINKKYRLIKPGDRVIDIGSAPGGWLEVASKEVGANGLVIGVDLVRVKPVGKNVKTITEDIYSPEFPDKLHVALGKGNADSVIADLSPKVSGIWEMDQFRQIELCHKVVDILPSILVRDGRTVTKAFQGTELDLLIKRLKKSFSRVEVSKPDASRSVSSEVYLVAMGFTGQVEPRSTEPLEEERPSESPSDSAESELPSDRLIPTPS